MSYDLYFYVKEDKAASGKGPIGKMLKLGKRENENYKIDASTLSEFLLQLKFIELERNDSGFSADYANRHTRASFTIDFDANSDRDTNEKTHYQGFKYTGLSCSIRYGRPLYYGYEAVAVVKLLCEKFRLLVSDPQGYEIGIDSLPVECDVATLVRSWRHSDSNVTRKLMSTIQEMANGDNVIMMGDMTNAIFHKPDDYQVLPDDRAIAWWKYVIYKDAIEKIARDLKVLPRDIRILRRKKDGRLLVATSITEGVAALLPEFDLCYIEGNEFREGGFVGSLAITHELSDSPQYYYRLPGMKLPYLSGSDAKKAVDILRGLTREPADNYEPAPPGTFLDYDPLDGGGTTGEIPVEAIRSLSVSLVRDKEFDSSMEKGMSLKERGDFKGALRAFEICAGIKPDAPGPHFYAGLMFKKLGLLEESIREYRKEA